MNGLVCFIGKMQGVADCAELDNHYSKFHSLKAQRIAERGSKCSYTAPEAIDGAIELLEELYATGLFFSFGLTPQNRLSPQTLPIDVSPHGCGH